jgi:hypothetical protein
VAEQTSRLSAQTVRRTCLTSPPIPDILSGIAAVNGPHGNFGCRANAIDRPKLNLPDVG